jgi:hypothetical protein
MNCVDGSTHFPIYNLIIILLLDAIQAKILMVFLREPQTKI